MLGQANNQAPIVGPAQSRNVITQCSKEHLLEAK
jgi:hypothetical protein